MASKGKHEGHRERMREKFKKTGFNGWPKHEILEYLLFYVIPVKNTNELAHDMLDYSNNSFVTLLQNTEDMRMRAGVKDVGEKTFLFLRAIKEFIDLYKLEELKHKPLVITKDNMADVLHALPFKPDREDILMICMDKFMKLKNIINITEVSDAMSASVTPEKLLETAILDGAAYVVLAHNHPNGNPEPSLTDYRLTELADRMFSSAGIILVDHYVVSDNGITSIKMCYRKFEENDEIIL